MSTPADWLPDMGTQWVHVWVDHIGPGDTVLVWHQYEQAGVKISGPCPLNMPAHAARAYLDRLSLCRPVRHSVSHVSIPLD